MVSERTSNPVPGITALCGEVLRTAEVDGSAVSLMSPGHMRELLCATDSVSLYLDELQLTMGQGPCVDAFETGQPTHVPDLAATERRWPGFAAEASGRVGALFAYPLRGGALVFGVLELYRVAAGPLSVDGDVAARGIADRVAATVLDAFSIAEAEGGIGSVPQWFGSGTPDSAIDGDATRPHVNIAVGMMSVQLHSRADDAFARLRAAAYSSRRPIEEIARDVVERRVQFEDTTDE